MHYNKHAKSKCISIPLVEKKSKSNLSVNKMLDQLQELVYDINIAIKTHDLKTMNVSCS